MDGKTTTSDERSAEERTYDPLWMNARTFLRFLAESDMLRRQLFGASIGQFVLIQGHVVVLDLAMLKGAWDSPVIRKLIEGGATSPPNTSETRQQRRANAKKTEPSPPSEVDILFALLPMMPHSIQINLISETGKIWCSLDENSIVGKSSDLVLKHGSILGGVWSVLGVIDAYPSEAQDSNSIELAATLAATPVGQLAARLASVARTLVGRPDEAWGVTPLLIFREVSAIGDALVPIEATEAANDEN